MKTLKSSGGINNKYKGDGEEKGVGCPCSPPEEPSLSYFIGGKENGKE